MHWLYQLVSYLFIGLLLPVWALHPKLRQGILRRLGLYRDVTPPGTVWPPSRGRGPRILLHGASAGDLLALLPIIEQLRARAPESTLMVSTMTNSGFSIAQDRLQKLVDGVTFVPYDLPGATRRAMQVLAPDLLVLEYTELWPNLIHAARRRGAKVALTNGRLSEALVRRYRWMAFLFGNPLAALDLLLMREEVEADRALALGAPAGRIRVTGNTKFDNLLKAAPEAGDALREALGPGLWLVAGSTHEGEEKGVLHAFRGMRAEATGLRLLIAPRYVERAPKIAALARHEGFTVGIRSEAAAHPDEVRAAEVVLLDSMGELATAYSLATLVFVGGSFVPRGGQNILEPSGQGRPVLFGPNMRNFRDSVEVLLGRGGIQVTSVEQLERVGRELLARPDELEHLGGLARAAVQKIRGASERNAEALLQLVERV
ncbi:MAG: 3-deoxy-D-manno-octulosonic acid transferase [Myxococcales bacterium]|nr:3-deoxy-D-manno-octulosonic acid transferase [Myxococcales bacterium]